MIGIVGSCVVAVAACGSTGGKLPTEASQASPVNLSVYVNNSHISVSPASTGAGPVVFIVTNQASQSEALAIVRSGQSSPIAKTAPINPQGTTQVSVNFQPGDYTLATAQHATDAQLSQGSPIRSASIHIGQARNKSANALLGP
jgi:hypothetical protein